MDTTCLTAVVLLLAAFSARSVGQTETTTPAVTTTPAPMMESSNDVPETSPEDSLHSIEGQTVSSSLAGADHSPSESTPEGGTTVFPVMDGSVANSIATGFEKESDKFNELDADQSVKEVGSVVPENSVAAAEGPAVKMPNETTTTATVQSTTEADATTRVEHELADSTAVPTTQESVSADGDKVPTFGHVSDDATTSASSSFPVTTASDTSPEQTTGPYNAGVNTEPSVSSETTPAPYSPEATPSYGPFNTEQPPDTSYSPLNSEVPAEATSVFGDNVPQNVEPFTAPYGEPAHGSGSSPQTDITPAEVYTHEATTGSFQGPETHSENFGSTVPSYLYSAGTSPDAYPVFGTDYSTTHDAAATEGVTSEHTQQDTSDSTTQSTEGASSVPAIAYDAKGTPTERSTQLEQATTTSSPVFSTGAHNGEGDIHTDTGRTVSHPDPVNPTSEPTQSASEAESTPTAQHDGATENHDSFTTGLVEHETEPTIAAVSQQHDETTTSGGSALSTTLHESGTDVPTTVPTVTEQSSSNSSKMGRALTDAIATDADEPVKAPTTTTPTDATTTYAPPPVTNETPQAQSTPAPSSESVPSTTSESSTNVVSGDEPTTVAPSESVTTASNDVQAAMTEVTTVVSAGDVVSHTASSPGIAQTGPESATEAATTGAPSTPVSSTVSQASGTDAPATTTSPTAAIDEGTTPAASDTTAPEMKLETTTVFVGEQSISSITEATTERAAGSTTSAATDVTTQGVTQSLERSMDISTESLAPPSSESSTQSPDVAQDVQTGTEQLSSGTATTTSHPIEAEAPSSSGSDLTHDSTVATLAVTQEPTTEAPLQPHTEPTTQTVSGSTESVVDAETTGGGATSVEPATPVPTEEPVVARTEEATTPPPSPETTPVHEATTATSLGVSNAVGSQAETTQPLADTTAPDGTTAGRTFTVTTPAPVASDTPTLTAETGISPESETTVSGAEEATSPASSGTTTARDEITTAVEIQTTTPAAGETTPVTAEAVTALVETTTQAVSAATSTPVDEATTPSMEGTTGQPTVAVTESGTTRASSGASRSPKQLPDTTTTSTPAWTTEPHSEPDTKHTFTTASDLFSTTRLYTFRRQTTPPAPPEEPTTEQATTEGLQWTAGVTTAPEVGQWSSTTQRTVFTAGSTTGPEAGSTVDASCNIVEGSLPVSCLLPEELNHTVTVKFADLNRTRAETFRTEARVWLLDYCSKNGIPLGDPTVVFLNGEDRGMDLISFFVVNRTRGSAVPGETVVAVLNNMKLTFEDKLGTAITDVFYGLPVLQKKDVGVAGFLGSSLGLVYVIVGAALAALLLLALLVVIMVKCRTISSHQYSPDSEKLTKDLHMRAEMGDLRPADEILKEEAQLKEGLNGNGTHINGDSWVVPYAQIVNERKSTTDAQDTRL